MADPVRPRPLPSSPAGARSGPSLVPCLLLKGGRVLRPGEHGPVVADDPSGKPFDPFDVIDRLAQDHSLVYVVDLDGIERGDPQLDYVQELSRDVALWVDAGVRTADQAIDVLVAGARRAVLSSAYLNGPRELRRAWRLSTELVFDIEVANARLAPAHEGWGTDDPAVLAETVRAVGPDRLIVSPREGDIPWPIVRAIATAGPTWVDGSFRPTERARLEECGARGGIFHIDELLDQWKS